jgi:uncharacterized protein
VIVYVDSSAIGAVLLGEPMSNRVQHALEVAERVCTSTLTLVECSRALIHAKFVGRISAHDESSLRSRLRTAQRDWIRLNVDQLVLARACEPLPADPVRALDAIHIATACILRDEVSDVVIVSLDRRMRECATQLGFAILPEVA